MGLAKRVSDGLGAFFRRLFALGGKRPLCDSCKYDYGNVCSRPERPNALRCPDYKHK